jgi:para-nitrobenzyl esterase
VRRFGVLALLMVALAAIVAAPAMAKPRVTDVRVTQGIVYGQGQVNLPSPGAFDLLLDLYEPVTKSQRRRPAVVVIHGGGFSGGSRLSPDFATISRALAELGFVVANIDYRLIPQDPVPSARVAPVTAAVPDVPIFVAAVAAVDDTLTALDWLQDHAKQLRIRRKGFGLVGESAGAITAAHVAYTLDDFGVAAPQFRFVADLWGGIIFDIGALATQLEAGEAPLFVVHGTADNVVPAFLDDRLVARAREVGVPVEYHRIEGAGHGARATGFFTREVLPGQTAFERMLDFAEKHLY